MISQLSLNNDFETPTKLSSLKTCPFSNRLKAKSSDIDIHTAISDDEDDLIELDKRTFTHDDAFNIKINMDKPISPTIRAATKKKNISKGKTIIGTQKKLPFTPLGGVRKPKIEPKSFNKSKSMKYKFMPTPTIRLLEDQIKACAYAFSTSLDPSEELVVTNTIRATRPDFDHFLHDKPITEKILELVALRCIDDQSDVSFKTTW
ncbi:Ulp1 protease family, carboxy-terminal domain protein [Arachis hypogaea]|nr:Ulp1 protease family, carboxy-terminal domain protein [Arachis hypogaea]